MGGPVFHIELVTDQLRNRIANFEYLGKKFENALGRRARPVMTHYFKDAKAKITPKINVGATGNLRKSFSFGVTGRGFGIVGRFGSDLYYSGYYEYGAAAHTKKAPLRPLIDWAKAKIRQGIFTVDLKPGRNVQNQINGAAFIIARGVQEKQLTHRMKGHNAIENWLRPNEQPFLQALLDAINAAALEIIAERDKGAGV